MEDLVIKAFPGALYNNSVYLIPITSKITLLIDDDMKDIYAYDDKGTDFTDKIKAIIDRIDMSDKNRIILFVQQFIDLFQKIYGMNCADSTSDLSRSNILRVYDGAIDTFWEKMKEKHNVKTDRKLKCLTYGTIYESDLELAKYKIQETFNAIVLRGGHIKGNMTFKMLVKLRGTDKRVQQEVRDALLFEPFVENIIKTIEEKNLERIAIVCRAGHHRSVSVSEMLFNLYPSIQLKHLTFDR